MRANLFCAVLAACLFAPVLASAQVVDDFEQGSFSLSGTSFDSGVQSSLLPIHCISSDRTVRMFINGNPSGADLTLNGVDNGVTMVWGDNGGSIEFDYDLGAAGVDLTYGGTKNALRVHVPVAEPAGQLGILLHDSAGAPGERINRPVFGAGVYSIPLSDFVSVDVGDIHFIQLVLDVPDFGDYHITDFRAWEDPAVAAGMDVTVGTVAGPPYPTDAILIEMSAQEGTTGGTVQTEILSMCLSGFADESGDLGAELVAMDSGGGVGMPGEQTTIVLNGVVNPTKRTHFRGATFQWQRVSSRTNTALPSGLPKLHPPDPGKPTYFSVKVTSYSLGQLDAAQFRTDYLLSFSIPDGNSMIFTKAGIEPTPFSPLGFDVIVEMSESGAPNKSQQTGAPLMEIQINASSYHYESAVAAPAWTGESISLWAQPSVMDASTQLWLSRALEQETRLRLFDLAGRAIRTLTVPAGREFTVWDGRDARGNRVASGMYMLKALDVPSAGSAKIVKLR